MSNLFCILSWKQPKQLCLYNVFDSNKRWKYRELAQALLFAKILSSCSVVCVWCVNIANFTRSSVTHSGVLESLFLEKNTYFLIGLEKADVKRALWGSHFNNSGRCSSLGSALPSVVCQRTLLGYYCVRKGSRTLNSSLMAPVSPPALASKAHDNEKFASFDRVVGSFSLNGTDCLQLIPQVSSVEEACFRLVA